MHILILLAAFFASAGAAALPPDVQHVGTFRGIDQYRLKSNGMTILLAPGRRRGAGAGGADRLAHSANLACP